MPIQINETLTAAFELAVKEHGHRTALGAGSWQPTYDELNATANRLAHALLRRGGAPGDRVAVIMRHDTPLVAAVLSILKAGKIIVTLNPTHPPARLKQLIEDAEPSVIVVDSAHRDLATEILPPACSVIQFEREAAEGPTSNPSVSIGADDTAFLVYTSGSTGRPKGVMFTHRQRLHAVKIQSYAMAYDTDDHIPLFGSLSAGQGIGLMLCALLNGAMLCPFPMMTKGTTGLQAWMIDQGITVYASSASIFRHFMKSLGDDVRFPLVHAVRLASESATSSDFGLFQQHFAEHCKLVHTFCSSEGGTMAFYRLSPSDTVPEGRLPIGFLTDGTELLFVDERNKPVKSGDVGEIVVRSRYLAAGYWRQPALTAERFSGEIGGVRQFRTGDLGRMTSDGLLEYLGRIDSQVKIRGNRVELDEVEGALQRLPGVEYAAVVSVKRPNQEHALTAYVVAEKGHSWSERSLRIALRKLLPASSIPSAFLLLDALPITSSGKIDREKLRQVSPLLHQEQSLLHQTTVRPAQSEPVGPRTKIQQTLLALWRDVLNREDIGCDDDFFILGGDSLSAVDLLHRIEDELQYELPLTILMEAPTVRQLEARLEKSTLGATNNVIRIHTAGRQRPLFSVCGRYGHAVRQLPVLRSLGPDQPCYALQPPGMDWTAVGCATLEQMAAHYLREVKAVQPRGPYRLLGTSFGGLVTYEMALQLQRNGEQVEFLGMVDTSPTTVLFEGAADVQHARLNEDAPSPSRLVSIEARNLRVAEAHVRARGKYILDRRSDRSIFRGVLTYFYCTGNPIIAGHDRRRLWEHFAQSFLLVPLPGVHGSFHTEPQASALQNLLRVCLDGEPLIGSDPAKVFDQTFRIEKYNQCESIISSNGNAYRIEQDRTQGYVESIRADAEAIWIGGWAVEHCQRQPAQKIAVFHDDRFLGYGTSGISRPEVAERLGAAWAEHAGFFFRFGHSKASAERERLRLFVLATDGHAAELRVRTN